MSQRPPSPRSDPGWNQRSRCAEVRREYSLRRLQQADCRIEQLSRELGFSEPSAFYKAFKGWFGVSPKAYQQQAGGDSTSV